MGYRKIAVGTIRSVITSVGLVAFLALSVQVSAQDRLVIQSWGGTNLDILRKDVIEPFEKATNIKFEVRIQENTFDGLTKLRAQRAAPVVDLWNTSTVPAMIGHQDGLGVPLDESKIPNAQYVADGLFQPECIVWEQYFFGLPVPTKTPPRPLKLQNGRTFGIRV